MKLESHTDYGDLISLDDFIACCESGGFIDYDGYGYYATSTIQSDIVVHPSDILKRKINENFTHVMWYNR
jgi:hypothetical protein